MTNPIKKIRNIPDETAIIAVVSTELGYKAWALSNVKDYHNIATMAVCRAVIELLDTEGLDLYEKGMELLKSDLKRNTEDEVTFEEVKALVDATPLGNA